MLCALYLKDRRLNIGAVEDDQSVPKAISDNGAPGGSLVAFHRQFEFANLEDPYRFPAISGSIGLRAGSG